MSVYYPLIRILVWVLPLFLFSLAEIAGQDYNYRFRHITNKEGLTNSSVNVIHKDHLGFMWFGTLNGLHRYNGYEIESFTNHPQDPNSIAKNTIKSIYNDHRNRIWITFSSSGISFFDPEKEHFINFNADSGNTGIYDTPVNYLFEDRDRNIWICTDKGICTYDENIQKIVRKTLIIDGKPVTQFPADYVMESSDGMIWITSSQHHFNNGQGLIVYDPSQRKAYSLNTSINNALPTDKITYIFEDSKMNIWLGTRDHGVLKLSSDYEIENTGEWTFERFLDYDKQNVYFKRSYIRSIFESSDGNFWFSTQLGLVMMEIPDSEKPNLRFFLHHKRSGVGDNPINEVVEDDKGNIWAIPDALNAGLFKYELKTDNYSLIRSEKYNGSSISSDKFNDIFIDEHDIIWLATGNNGVDMLDLNQKKFSTYRSNHGTNRTLSSNKIFGMDEDQDGNVWIATYKGLNKYDLSEHMFFHYHNDKYPGLLNQDEIFEVYCDSHHKLWIGYLRILLSKFDPKSMKNKKFTQTEDVGGNFLGWSVRSIIEDQNQNLWIGSYGSGLWYYDRSQNSFEVFKHQPNENSINSNQIFALLEDRNGLIWIGTKNDGLNSYNPVTKKFTSITHNPQDTNSIPDNQILCITESESDPDILWIGSAGSGLIKFDRNSGTFKKYSEEDGLCDNMVKGILIDDQKNLWLSTNDGLAKFNPQTGKFITFTYEDGIQGNEFNILSYHKSTDGKMFFGGTNGLTVFDPSEIHKNPYKATPLIHKISLFNKPIRVGEKVNGQVVLQQSIFQTEKVKLNHKNNVFSIGFTALHYASPKKIKYYYKLDGFETKWNVVDASRRIATYTNLDPGSYNFRVKATNNDGVLSEQESSLHIEVLPAWWETKLFRLLLTLLVIAIGFLWMRIRTKRLKSQKRELREEVERRTTELSKNNEILMERQNELLRKNHEISEMSARIHELDQSRLRFYTNISHEFRTPLTLMLTPTEKLLTLPANTQIRTVKDSIRLIHKNEKRLLNLINQLLEIRKIETGTLRLNIVHGDPLKMINEIAESFIQTADQKKIRYNIEVKNTVGEDHLVYFDPDKLEKIAYNLLSNAFKYTNSKGRVILSASLKNQELLLAVIDTGIGIKKTDLPNIFNRFNDSGSERRDIHVSAGIGLSYVKDLIEIHKGTIKVKSKINEGSEFVVSIPVSQCCYSDEEMAPDHLNYSGTECISSNGGYMDDLNSEGEPAHRSSDADSSKPTLLIVEDNDELRLMLRNELQEYFAIFESCDGEEGLVTAQEQMPDVILSDVMMPGLNGIELCDKLKRNPQTSHIPIVLLTAKVGEESELKGIRKGADDYISKPFNIKILYAKLLNHVQIRQKLKIRFSKETSLLPESLAQNNLDEQFIQKVVEIIKSNISESGLNADKIAGELNVSRSFLYEKIHALSGKTVNEFVRIIRLKAACELMENKNLTLSEIAYSVGFTSLNYFSKSFKKQFNYSPSEYIEKNLA